MTTLMVPQDKAQHFIYGALAALLGSFIAFLMVGPGLGRVAALASSLLVGVGKEVHDAIANRLAERRGEPKPHGVEASDIIATFLGGLVVAARP